MRYAAVLLTVLVTAMSSACRTADREPLVVGVQFHGLWTDYTDEARVGVLDALRDTGVDRVRIDASWAMLEPDGPDRQDPVAVARLDRLITLATDRGLRPLLTFWLTPGWAGGNASGRILPRDPADYAAAVGWAARHWAGRVDWEIWNEPNSEDFAAGADPSAYAALLRAAYPAIKAADPGAVVVGGSVQYNDVDWLRRMYGAGARGSFDVLSTHPYQSPADLPPTAPDDGSPYRLAHAGAVRALMVQRGDADVPMWFTELGWSTAPDGLQPWEQGVSPQQQADYLGCALDLVTATMPYVRAVFVYGDRDGATVTDHVDGFGLLNHDGTPKPALGALGRYVAARNDVAPSVLPPPAATCMIT